MKAIALAAGILTIAFTTSALADAPKFTASCPTGITVKSNGKGKIKINGAKATVKSFSATAWEARGSGVAIDISSEADGSGLIVSYTGKGGANGICQVTSSASESSQAPAGSNAAGDMNGVKPKDQQACLAAVSNKTNNGTVDVVDAYSSEANNTVIIGVGEQHAKWRCLVKNGRVAEVMSLAN